jgi:hypothetical protein
MLPFQHPTTSIQLHDNELLRCIKKQPITHIKLPTPRNDHLHLTPAAFKHINGLTENTDPLRLLFNAHSISRCMLGKPFFITALCFHRRRVEDCFRIWKAAKNVLNKRTADKGRTSSLGARRGTHNT